jgi:hypothetical protein
MTRTQPRETFHMLAYAWDITAAKALAAGREPNGTLTPADWAGVLSLIDIGQGQAATADLGEPLIAVPVDDAGLFIIYGWHHIRRALTDDVDQLDAVVLTAEEEYAIRLQGGDKPPSVYIH